MQSTKAYHYATHYRAQKCPYPSRLRGFLFFGVNERGKFDFVGVICTIRSTLRMILVMEYATMVQAHR